jgi:hypothetical protein
MGSQPMRSAIHSMPCMSQILIDFQVAKPFHTCCATLSAPPGLR